MRGNCMREASKACLNSCCVNPEIRTSTPKSINTVDYFSSAVLSSINHEPTNTNFTNHESLPSFTQLTSALQIAFPHYTFLADDIRAREYYHLSLSNRVCLDYIGNGLYSYSQLQKPTSRADADADAPFFSTIPFKKSVDDDDEESEFEAAMRKRIARYMNVEDYSLFFTPNQSSAFRLVADSYPFNSNQNLLTVYDHENESAQAMIEAAQKKGARPQSAAFSWPNFRVHSRKLRKLIVDDRKNRGGLFVFPLQSRMTGSRYSYQWMNLARDNGWHVLLDACALGAKEMETLGLSLFQPDFITCSFYKVFGENPAGFCCLLVKKSIDVTDLSKTPAAPSTGVISLIPTKGSFGVDDQHQTTPSSSSTSEQITEETLEVEGIKSVQTISGLKYQGLDHADTLGLILITSRSRILINWLVNALLSLRHPHYSGNGGLPLVAIYGPKIKPDRGPALAFNVYDWKAQKVDPILVQKLADRNNISVTCGFLNNIWFSEDFQQEKKNVLENRRGLQSSKHDDEKKKKKKKQKKKKGKQDYQGIEVVSVSLGMLNNFEDMCRVWTFVSKFLDADFVEKERWRYTALNQTTIEL